MRLLFVVPRYDADAIDPAERQCHEFATRLALRGHTVEVAASCARHAADWADEAEPGETLEAGVVVHRFRVRAPRDDRFFGPLHQRVLGAAGPVAHVVEREWMRRHGPDLPELAEWLRSRTRDFDVVVCFGHLAATSFDAIRVATGVVPTVLHPFADDEPELRLGILDEMFHAVDALACNLPEEQLLLTRRFGALGPSAAIGTGVAIDEIDEIGPDVGAFRARLGLADRPYLLAVGPLGAGDGSLELVDMFAARTGRRAGDVTLVVLGEAGPDRMHAGVVTAGPVDALTAAAAIAGCLALVQPSYRENLSTDLLAAWAHRRPALVQGRCEALVGEARRSGGAIPYSGFAEFEAAVDLLVAAPELATTLGDAGRGYVELRYGWDDVLARYEWFLEDTMAHWRPPSAARRLPVG